MDQPTVEDVDRLDAWLHEKLADAFDRAIIAGTTNQGDQPMQHVNESNREGVNVSMTPDSAFPEPSQWRFEVGRVTVTIEASGSAYRLAFSTRRDNGERVERRAFNQAPSYATAYAQGRATAELLNAAWNAHEAAHVMMSGVEFALEQQLRSAWDQESQRG